MMKQKDKVVALNDYKAVAKGKSGSNDADRTMQKPSGKPVKKGKGKKNKAKKRFRINWERIIKTVLGTVLTGVLLYFIGSSFLFDIAVIEVKDNHTISTDKIINLTEIEIGDNFFAVSTKQAKKNLEYYPFIKQAAVSKRLPNKIIITVTERPAIGYIVTPDGYIQVSDDGRMLAVQQSLNNYDLPVISGLELNALPNLGGIIENEKFQQALEILTSCDQELLNNLAELNVSQDQYIVAYTNQKIEVRLGAMEDITGRLSDLDDIIREIVERKIPIADISYIDMRYAGAPVIRMKD